MEEEIEICPLCGKRTAKIEGAEGLGWDIVRCNNCFTCHVHESIDFQIKDKGKDIELNKRKRYNCIYQYLLNNSLYNGHYYFKFFYEDNEKGQKTNQPIFVNVTRLFSYVTCE